MFRFSRKYEEKAEFEARQMCFDFAIVARAVLRIALDARKNATRFLADFARRSWDGWRTATAPRFFQLVLPADDFHQVELTF